MDYANLFGEILKLSPFVATLFYFLYTIWNTMQKKDEALTATMKEHSASMLQVQKEQATAQNNSADATRQLAGAIGDLRVHLCDSQDDLSKQLAELKTQLPRNGSVRRLPTTPNGAVNP